MLVLFELRLGFPRTQSKIDPAVLTASPDLCFLDFELWRSLLIDFFRGSDSPDDGVLGVGEEADDLS